MAGVLEFTLGLQVNKFIEGLHIGSAAVIGLEKAGEALKATFEAAWGQIEKGAALNELSRRTGETVANLFKLQKGFKAAGLGADDVGPAIFMLNKSLGGVNEMGEQTSDIFRRAGLSVTDLKKAGSAGAMEAVLGKMSKMDQTSATKFGASVFGRGEAANMVQLSRSTEEFREAMKRAQAQADVFQRVSEVFHAVEKALERVRAKLDPIFLVIAEHIAPALEKALSFVNDFDLSPLVNGIGESFDVFAQAFSEGKVFDLLTAGFSAAVEYMGNLLFGLLGSSKLWSGIVDVWIGEFVVGYATIAEMFLNLGTILKAALSTAFQMVFEQIGKTKLGEWLGISGNKAKSFGENYADEKDNAKGANAMLDSGIKWGAGKYKGGVSKQIEAFTEASANAGGPAQDALKDMVSGLLGRNKSSHKHGKTKKGTRDETFTGGHKPAATAIEKMGFVFSGGATTDHTATTARNTTKMVAQLGILVASKSRPGTPELTNAHPS